MRQNFLVFLKLNSFFFLFFYGVAPKTPESGRSFPGQVENFVKKSWRTEPVAVAIAWEDLGKGVKG